MTVRGLICVILEALLLVLGLGTGYRALLMAAFCLGLVLVLAVLSLLTVFLTTRSMGEVTPAEVYRGDGITYTLAIKGPVFLPVAGYLSLLPPGVERQDKQALTRHAFLLLPAFRSRRTVAIPQTAPYAGHWQAGAERMWYEDLFGLFRVYLRGIARRRLRRHLTVLPHIHSLDMGDRSAAGGNGLTSTLLRSATDGEVLGDARLYQPGDPLKRVHWKLTARTQEVYTRQFEPQENTQVLLLLDLVCRSSRRREVADLSVETALSLLTCFVERNMAVRLIPLRAPRDTTLTERRVSTCEEIRLVQEALLSHRYTTEAQPLDAWQLQDSDFSSAGTVLVITDNPSEQLMLDLETLAGGGRRIACITPCVGVEPLDLPVGQVCPVRLYRTEDISEKVGDSL